MAVVGERRRPTHAWRKASAVRSVALFVVDRFFGELAFAPVSLASLFAAAEASPILGRLALGFGALALFAVFIEVDDHRLCQFRVGGFIPETAPMMKSSATASIPILGVIRDSTG